MRRIAAASEQDLDYADELKLSWAVDEDLLQMSFLADDLRGMCLDLITLRHKRKKQQHVNSRSIEKSTIENLSQSTTRESKQTEKL